MRPTLRSTVERVMSGNERGYFGNDFRGKLKSGRRRTTGQYVESDIPIRTLSHHVGLNENNEGVRPIVAWPAEFPIAMHSRGRPSQKKLLAQKIKSGNVIVDYDTDDEETSFTFSVPRANPDPTFFGLPEDTNTKVFALANNTKAEHAILLFVNGSNVWSVGYGFSGSGSLQDASHHAGVEKALSKVRKIPDSTRGAVAHAFETLQGALYTSDFLLANWKQEAHIIWVGSLNKGIKDRVLEYLSRVKSVELKSKGDYRRTGKLDMTNNTTLHVGGSFYTENASWISNDLKGRSKLNCLEWVKHILGVRLKCGLMGKPSGCNRITPDQWTFLTENGFLTNEDDVKTIQDSLLKTNVLSAVGDSMRYVTNNPRTSAACLGTACAVGAAFGPASIASPAATTFAAQVGGPACLGTGCVGGVATHELSRRGINKLMESKSNTPPVAIMTRKTRKTGGSGRKTRRKNKRRKTRNKRRRRRHKTQTNPPSVQRMTRSSRGGRKTRRKNKRRKTRNKRRRR